MDPNYLSLRHGKCPHCGADVIGLPRYQASAGVRCTRCDFSCVTTNPDAPGFCETLYNVWITCDETVRLKAIAVLSLALNVYVEAVRNAIAAEEPVAVGILSTEIQRLNSVCKPLGIKLYIEPEYRWTLE